MTSQSFFRIIAKPFSDKPSMKILTVTVALIWLIAFVVCIPYIISHRADITEEKIECYPDFRLLGKDAQIAFFWSLSLLISLLPCAALLFVYSRSIKHLKGRMSLDHTNRSTKRRLKENRRVISMFLLVVFVFFLLSAPYCSFLMAFSFLVRFNPSYYDAHMGTLHTINYWLFTVYSASSTVNPIIYCRVHRDIKNFLRTCFQCPKLLRKSNRSLLQKSDQSQSEQLTLTDMTGRSHTSSFIGSARSIGKQ